MALTQKLEFRQSHALVMTPQLMQAIKLLQLSNLDLVAYVENELERNPLLERTGEGEGEGTADADGDHRAANGDATPLADGLAPDWGGDRGSAHENGAATERAPGGVDEGPAADDAD